MMNDENWQVNQIVYGDVDAAELLSALQELQEAVEQVINAASKGIVQWHNDLPNPPGQPPSPTPEQE